MSRLALAARPAPDAAADALDALARALAPRVAELLADRVQDDRLVDVLDLLPGARRAERRAAQRACRTAAIAGAAKIARRWRAPRAAVEAWLRSLGPRPLPAADVDDLDELRERLARPTARRRRRRAAA